MNKSLRFFVMLVVLSLPGSGLFGQSSDLKRIFYLDPAKELTRYKVDTNNVQNIKSHIYNKEWYLSYYAALFLAERGYTDVIPMIKAKYDSALSGSLTEVANAGDYLTALYLLHDPTVIQMTKDYIDTILVRYHYDIRRVEDEISDAIRFLTTAGDYTRFDNLKMLVELDLQDTVRFISFSHARYAARSHTDFVLLIAYGEKPEYRQRVFNLLKSFALHPKLDCREKAEDILSHYFKDIPEALKVVKIIAQTDPDLMLRENALTSLLQLFKDPAALDMYKQFILSVNDTLALQEALSTIAYTAESPFAYAMLIDCYAQRQQSTFGDIIKKSLDNYQVSRLSSELPVSTWIDSLRGYTIDCQNLNWLDDANFVKELTNHLDNAKKHLTKGDSVNCDKEVEKFQEKVNKEYEKTIDNQKKNKPKDKRFVTVEGWKFLYYNAQYIIERLPEKEKKK